MSVNVFIDTNIILYAYSKTEIGKSLIANEVIFESKNVFISKQVINEAINILIKKYHLKIKTTYNYQYYDSLILATALENNCSILYSEDMQHNQYIDNQLTIINPFKES